MLQLRRGEAYLNFTGTLRTKATEKHYLFLIQRYAAFRKTFDLHQIIEQDSRNPKLAAAHIRHFLTEIQTTIKLSPGSIHNYRHALRHFYEMNDITLNWKKIRKFSRMEDSNAGMRQKDRAYTHQEIQVILAHSNEKVRAIILLLASSGIRVGAIYSIKLKHLKRVESHGLYQLLIYPGHKDEYITFCTPEATQAIDSYLSYRQRAGEKLNDDSPLFRTDFYAADIFRVRNNIKPMSTASVSKAIQIALKSAGLIAIDTVTDSSSSSYHSLSHEVQRNHGFRKFANTQMVLAEVNGAAKEMLLGHSIGLDDKYYRPTAQQLFDEYAKAVDPLTINEENRLRRKVDSFSKTLQSEKQKEDRISVLENKMQSLVSTLSKLTEQGQVNTIAQTLYSSGILKEGKEVTIQSKKPV